MRKHPRRFRCEDTSIHDHRVAVGSAVRRRSERCTRRASEISGNHRSAGSSRTRRLSPVKASPRVRTRRSTPGRVSTGRSRAATCAPGPARYSSTSRSSRGDRAEGDLRHGLLWVSGAQTGKAAVYNLETGDPVADLTFTTANSFVNDVVVTRHAAYFTDSRSPVIYRVPVADDGTIGEPRRSHCRARRPMRTCPAPSTSTGSRPPAMAAR